MNVGQKENKSVPYPTKVVNLFKYRYDIKFIKPPMVLLVPRIQSRLPAHLVKKSVVIFFVQCFHLTFCLFFFLVVPSIVVHFPCSIDLFPLIIFLCACPSMTAVASEFDHILMIPYGCFFYEWSFVAVVSRRRMILTAMISFLCRSQRSPFVSGIVVLVSLEFESP